MYDPEEVLGGYDSLIQIIDDNAATFTAKGLSGTTFKTGLTANRTLLFNDKNARNNKRADLAMAQATFEQDGDSTYDGLSDAIDIIAGIFGKKTPKGKQVLAIRKNIVGKRKKNNSSSSSSTSNSSSSSN